MTSASTTPPPGQRPAILIVDDDRDLCLALAALLEMEGYATEVATDGPAAIEALERRRFRVAVLDITLQQIDGVHIARFMRKHWPDVRIAILSGSSEREVRARFSDYDSFSTKAQSMDTLVPMLARLARGG